MKNNLETMGRVALFRGRESQPGVPSTAGGVSMAFDAGSGIRSELVVEHDGGQVRGAELPGSLRSAERKASGTLAQKRAKPDFIAFALAYFFGACSTAADGAARVHLITPAPELELPTFTAILRHGRNVFAERLAGNYVEGFSLELGEAWASISAEVVGTGDRETNFTRASVTAPANSTTLTLASAVAGATAAERLANVYRVRGRVPAGEWVTAEVQAVSGDTPAVVTLAEAISESGTAIEFQVDHLPAEPSWCGLPEFVDESPLRLVDARVVVDGRWDGSELFGGEELGADLEGLTIAGKNNLELRRFPGAAGPAALALRGARELTVSLSRRLRDTVLVWQADHPETETLALALRLQGAPIQGGNGRCFGAEIIFPRCGILSAPVAAQNGRLAQAGDLVVLEDGNGGVCVRCTNEQASYL